MEGRARGVGRALPSWVRPLGASGASAWEVVPGCSATPYWLPCACHGVAALRFSAYGSPPFYLTPFSSVQAMRQREQVAAGQVNDAFGRSVIERLRELHGGHIGADRLSTSLLLPLFRLRTRLRWLLLLPCFTVYSFCFTPL